MPSSDDPVVGRLAPLQPLPEASPSDERDAEVAGAILAALAPAARGDGRPQGLHDTAARRDWPWLPTLEHGHLSPHPYCVHCGGVKYIGTLKAKPFGGLVNLAAALRGQMEAQGHKVSDAQLRLILRRLQSQRADDPYLLSRPAQERLVVEAFRVYTGLDEAALASYLRSC